jgi:hypothetical protein
MECDRLNRLVRSWYVQVQDETLAPARMVEFMRKHVESCDDCLADSEVVDEVKRITELVLPPSKMTKQVKSAKTRDVALPVVPNESGEKNQTNQLDDVVSDDAEDAGSADPM